MQKVSVKCLTKFHGNYIWYMVYILLSFMRAANVYILLSFGAKHMLYVLLSFKLMTFGTLYISNQVSCEPRRYMIYYGPSKLHELYILLILIN